jgi:hypothetical protein
VYNVEAKDDKPANRLRTFIDAVLCSTNLRAIKN